MLKKLKKFYVSFGQTHTHSISGKTLDKDCIAVIWAKNEVEAHDKAMEIFKGVFCFVYRKQPDMSFFSRGLIDIK